MSEFIDGSARKYIARLVRRLAAGAVTNRQFEDALPLSEEKALHDIYVHGIWPLYDDIEEHKLVERWALTREGRTWLARIVLFLRSGLPYRYPEITGISQIPVVLLSLFTLGWFGRFWTLRKWRSAGADEAVWPFFTRSEYEATRQHPPFFAGNAHSRDSN
ncbi:MAG TPA: hypothetical protein VI457_11430 [Methylococcaceae bacterium]|nr:hypothetical protein [Methylococcaceae bacterium]